MFHGIWREADRIHLHSHCNAKENWMIGSGNLCPAGRPGKPWRSGTLRQAGAAMAVLNIYHGGNYYLYPEDDGGWEPRRMPQGQLLVSDARLQVYPNPANSFLNVVVSGTDVWDHAMLTVYDAVGRVIENQLMTMRHILLDTRKWASGSYVVEVRTNGFAPIKSQVHVVR